MLRQLTRVGDEAVATSSDDDVKLSQMSVPLNRHNTLEDSSVGLYDMRPRVICAIRACVAPRENMYTCLMIVVIGPEIDPASVLELPGIRATGSRKDGAKARAGAKSGKGNSVWKRQNLNCGEIGGPPACV